MSRFRIVLFLTLVALLPSAALGLTTVQDPLLPSELVFTEFFDDLFRMPPFAATPTVIPNAQAVSGPIAVDQNGMILFFDETRRLSRFDVTTSIITPISSPLPVTSSSRLRFALESPDSTLVLYGNDLFRIDMNTGGIAELLNGDPLYDGFFSANDLTVTPSGRIFVTEFFNTLWEVDPISGGARVVSPRDDLIPQAMDTFPNGDLLIQDFSPDRLVRVNPDTGEVSLFSDDLPVFIDDFAVLANGDVVLTGEGFGLNFNGSIVRYDGVTGQRTILYQTSPFFSPGSIAVAPGPVPVPEPATVLLVAVLLPLCGGRSFRIAGT
jgi:hypothetical protein